LTSELYGVYYRDKIEIAIEILKLLKRGQTKTTRLMVFANLDHARCGRWLRVLESKGLIARESMGKREFFALTQAGRVMLVKFRPFRKLLEDYRDVSRQP